jgi:hypothetical protein
MSLLDKLRESADLPPETDLLEFFGVGPDRFRLEGGLLVVGDEAVPLADAKAAVRRTAPSAPPGRTVIIRDL